MRWMSAFWQMGFCVTGVAVLFAGIAGIATGCREVSETECQNPPMGSVTAWIEDVHSLDPTRIVGVVEAVSSEDEKLDLLSIVDDDGTAWRVRFRVPGKTLPVEMKHRYQFEIHYVEGWPSASSLLVSDEDGLLFAGVSDWDIGVNVAKSGVPGFGVEKVSTDCVSRPHNSCFDEIKNAVLKVTVSDETATLYHGESIRIGSYEITCLTCQDVVYNDSCADAGVIGVSYAVVRVPPESK